MSDEEQEAKINADKYASDFERALNTQIRVLLGHRDVDSPEAEFDLSVARLNLLRRLALDEYRHALSLVAERQSAGVKLGELARRLGVGRTTLIRDLRQYDYHQNTW